MSHPHHTRNLAWLDRLAVVVPGYGGYHRREDRLNAVFALRDAMTRRLEALKLDIRDAIQGCLDHEALSEIGALERIDLHIDRIFERVKHVAHGTEAFYAGPDIDHHRLEPLYELDHTIIETAEHLATHFRKPDRSHDRLAEIQNHLTQLEHQLDERVRLLQSLT
jgi:hypothetical protein